MNLIIQELAEQAGEYVNEVYTPPVRSKAPGKIWEDGHIDWHTQFNQKFAELIVKECLKFVEPDQTSGDEWCVTLDETAQSIKQHFGVEQ